MGKNMGSNHQDSSRINVSHALTCPCSVGMRFSLLGLCTAGKHLVAPRFILSQLVESTLLLLIGSGASDRSPYAPAPPTIATIRN